MCAYLSSSLPVEINIFLETEDVSARL